jgi:hypothetical protein
MGEKAKTAAEAVKDNTVKAVCAVGTTTKKVAGATKEKVMKTKEQIMDMLRDFQANRETVRLEALMKAVALLDEPNRVVMLTILKRSLLPRDWKDATGMVLGGSAGVGLAYLLDAGTGGLITGAVLGMGTVKGALNELRADPELSANWAALKLKATRYLAARALKKATAKGVPTQALPDPVEG